MNKNNILYMTVVIVVLICFSPVYFLIRDAVALVKADKYFGVPEYCSIVISISEKDVAKNIVATYYGKNAEHYCMENYALQKEKLSSYSDFIRVNVNYIRNPIFPQTCERYFPKVEVTVKVTSNDKEYGDLYCQGLNK